LKAITSLFIPGNLIPIAAILLVVVGIRRAGRQPLWAEAYRRLGRNRAAIASVVVIAGYCLIAVLDSITWKSNVLAEPQSVITHLFHALHVRSERTYSAPFAQMTTGEPHPHPLKGWHILGTDGSGKDVLLETLRGCRTALIIGGFTSLLITPVAILLGMLAGYFGHRVDDVIQYIYTTLGSVPGILLNIAFLLVLGPGLINLCFALGITSWVDLCRLVRGETLKHRDREYVRAAKALGVRDIRILINHILPNILPVVIITVTLNFSSLVLSETILSYLGIGVPAGTGSWGNMIDAARLELARDPVIWWNLTAASTALFILVLALNVFSDALRDAVDPRLRSS
jgi:peptide/nickel transport system permease protein